MPDLASQFTPAPVTVPVADVTSFAPDLQTVPAVDTGYTPGDYRRPAAELVTVPDPQNVPAVVPLYRDRKQYDENGTIQRDEYGRPILTAPAP